MALPRHVARRLLRQSYKRETIAIADPRNSAKLGQIVRAPRRSAGRTDKGGASWQRRRCGVCGVILWRRAAAPPHAPAISAVTRSRSPARWSKRETIAIADPRNFGEAWSNCTTGATGVVPHAAGEPSPP